MTKAFTNLGVEGYSRASRFSWREAEIATFADLSQLLSSLTTDTRSMIVQGAVAEAWRDKKIIPRWKNDRDEAPASLTDAGSRAIHFDIDDVRLSEGCSWADPEAAAAATWRDQIVARLPAFDGVAFFWQASSSAGTKGKAHLAKFHFWALLDQAVDEATRKAILKLAGADEQVASINQPNFTASPIFRGVPDPLANVSRSGAVLGTEAAALDDIELPVEEIKQARQRASGSREPAPAPEDLTHGTTPEGAAILASTCARIARMGAGGRNSRINKAAYTIGGHVAGGNIAFTEAQRALIEAGRASGHRRHPEAIENGLRDGLRRPIRASGEDVDDGAPIEAFYDAPEADRADAIAAHPRVIKRWADEAILTMQAIAAVKRAYEEEGLNTKLPDFPETEEENPEEWAKAAEARAERKAAQRAVRRRVKKEFGLDYLPASGITDATPAPRVMLTGAQGVGKTRAVVGADGEAGVLHAAKGLVSIVFEPDHAMAAQAQADYDENAPEGAPASILLRGRSALRPGHKDETMCRLPEQANTVAQRGVSVPQALCKTCPFSDDCAYLEQERRIKGLAGAPDGLVIFAPHDYAFLPLPGEIDQVSPVQPHLAVFDERPRDMGIETAEASFEVLGETLSYDAKLFASGGEEADAHAANLRFIKPLQIALRNAGQAAPDALLEGLRKQGVDRDMVSGAVAGLAYFADRKTAQAVGQAVSEYNYSDKRTSLEARINAALEDREAKITRSLQTIFKALLIEIDKHRDEAVGLTVAEVQRRPGSREKALGVHAVHVRKMRQRKTPLLHLDGTGDHAMAEQVFGEMIHAHHAVERSPAERGDRTMQVVGADFHNAGLIGGKKAAGGKREPYTGHWKAVYDAQRADVLKVISDRPGCLVVGNKQVISALKPEEHGAHGSWFGAIRGRNDWEGIDRVVIVGREQPGPAAIEGIARAYAARDDDAFEAVENYPTARRGIRLRSGDAEALGVAFHPNRWAERVLRQIRDAEIVQAIDRIRPIFKTQPLEIVVLSPVALDLTVDQVSDWSDFRKGGTRIERAVKAARVVPLSGGECSRLMPEIWSTKRIAERDLKGAERLRQTVYSISYLPNVAIFGGVVSEYRVEGKAGEQPRLHRAFVAAPVDEARAVLEALTGPLRSFEIIEVLAGDPDAAERAYEREMDIAFALDTVTDSAAEALRLVDGIKAPLAPEPPPLEPPEAHEQQQKRRAAS